MPKTGDPFRCAQAEASRFSAPKPCQVEMVFQGNTAVSVYGNHQN